MTFLRNISSRFAAKYRDRPIHKGMSFNFLFYPSNLFFLNAQAFAGIVLLSQLPKGMKKSEALVQMEAALKKYTSEIVLTEEDLYDADKKQPPRCVSVILRWPVNNGQLVCLNRLLYIQDVSNSRISQIFNEDWKWILVLRNETTCEILFAQVRNSNNRPAGVERNGRHKVRVSAGTRRRSEHESRVVPQRQAPAIQ
jgi:hypothetical protein